MTSKSRTVVASHQDESPLRHLPLVDLLVDTKIELLELAMRSGLKVFTSKDEWTRAARQKRSMGSCRSFASFSGTPVYGIDSTKTTGL